MTVPYDLSDALGISQVAAWLRPGVSAAEGAAWVENKVRSRCQNPIPFKNVGGARLFSRIEIMKWLDKIESGTARHAAHPSRRKQTPQAIAQSKRLKKQYREAQKKAA